MAICIEAHDRRVPRADRCSVSDALLLKRTLAPSSLHPRGAVEHAYTLLLSIRFWAVVLLRSSWSGLGLELVDQPERERAAIYNHVLLCDPCQTKKITFSLCLCLSLILW